MKKEKEWDTMRCWSLLLLQLRNDFWSNDSFSTAPVYLKMIKTVSWVFRNLPPLQIASVFARVHSHACFIFWIFCSVHTAAVVAEWLRRWTWTSSATSHPMGFPRAGSNPAGCESFCQLDPRTTNIPYFSMLVFNILIGELSLAAFLY